jgi:signal transduction histidine kinase
MTAAIITISIVLIVVGGITASIVSYFRLQQHRTDAVAMASYRKLAEQAIEGQDELRARLAELDARLTEIAHILRSVE